MSLRLKPIKKISIRPIQSIESGKNTTLRPHIDASSVTLNINLNLPYEEFTGSSVQVFDNESEKVESLTYELGTALNYYGNVPHASEPITEGER